MGLGQVINVANSGLRVTQDGMDVVARNIANSDTAGYTRKSLEQENLYSSEGGRGVRTVDVRRQVNEFLQQQVRTQSSKLSGVSVQRDFLARIDKIFGAPGAASSLDVIMNAFGQSLQDLSTQPESFASRQSVVNDAQLVAQEIRTLSNNIQDLRQLAEDQIGDTVAEINDTLQHIVNINSELSAYGTGTPPADTLDQRDKFLDRLSELMDVQITENDRNLVSIRTGGGETILEGTAVRLEFDHQGDVGPQTLYDQDATKRSVGTVAIVSAAGFSIDLIANGALGKGRLGALVEMRDNVLTQAQGQLDELAHGLALSFSDRVVEGTAATSGAQSGFDVDLSGLKPGNAISLTYTQNGVEQTVSFVRVDDASQLPLDNSATPNPNDIVYGIDFSTGISNAISSIDTILTGTLGASLTVSNSSGNVLRVLDDGAGATSDVAALTARITSSATQDEGLQIPLFVDAGASASQAYSGSLDGGAQKLGFASRITFNSTILDNNELLVRHTSSPETELGDQSRPLDLYARLAETDFGFSAGSGIGAESAPYSGTVVSFAQRVISFQTGQAERIEREYAAQEIVTSSLQDRFTTDVTVDVDTELSNLISLQNAFAANARVVQTANELMDLLLQIG